MDVESSVQIALPIASGNEERYLEGWLRFGIVASAPAVAAALSLIRLRNPGQSGVIAVVEKASCWEAAVDQPSLNKSQPGSDFTVQVTTPMDPRGGQASTVIASLGSNAARLGSIAMAGQVTANGTALDFILTPNMEIPILPGDALTLWGNVVNQQVNGCFVWRERPLETSELT